MAGGRLKPLQLIIQGVERVTAPVREVNRRIESMNRPINKVRRSLRALAVESRLPQLGKAVRNVGSELLSLSKRALAFGTASAFSIGFAIKKFVDLGDQTAKTADKLGIGVEKLQELRFAADRAGISSQTFDMAYQRFTRRAAEAAAGTGEAKDALRFLGIQLKDSQGKMRPTEQLFGEVADAMARIEDPALRVRVAFKLFDSEGVSMVNMLKDGSGALSDLRREARELGLVMSEETARSAEQTQDSITNLMAVIKGIAFSVGSEMLPEVKQAVKDMTAWAQANRGLIKAEVLSFARDLARLVKGMAIVAAETIPRILQLVDAIGGFKVVAAIAAVVLSAKLIVALFNLGSAVFGVARRIPALIAGVRALNLAFLANPVFLVIAGITALVALAIVVYRNWAPIKKFFVDLWDRLTQGPFSFIDAAFPIIGLAKLIRRNWEPLTAFFDRLWGRVQQVASATGRFLGIGDDDPAASSAPRTKAERILQGRMRPEDSQPAGVRVGGRIGIEVAAARGSTARVTSYERDSSLIPIEVGLIGY